MMQFLVFERALPLSQSALALVNVQGVAPHAMSTIERLAAALITELERLGASTRARPFLNSTREAQATARACLITGEKQGAICQRKQRLRSCNWPLSMLGNVGISPQYARDSHSIETPPTSTPNCQTDSMAYQFENGF